MHVYEASAIGLAGEIVRPVRVPIPDQAAAVLPYTGGYESNLTENIRLDGFVSAKSARSSVGGSYDEPNKTHAAFALAVLEGLNICDIVTADRVVARLSSSRSEQDNESRFSLTGTWFDNLRIAGHRVEVRLEIDAFHQVPTFSSLANAYSTGKFKDFVHGSKLPDDVRYHEPRLYGLPQQGKNTKDLPTWYSVANRIQIENIENSGLHNFGSIIIVPDFGVIHLGELFVSQRQRRLSMLRVQMGSPVEGTVIAATCSAGDTTDSTGPR